MSNHLNLSVCSILVNNNVHVCVCVCMCMYACPCACMFVHVALWAYGVVVSMFDFHCSDRGSNPGRDGEIS